MNNKKTYLKDLTMEKRIEIVMNNKELMYEVFDYFYEQQMFLQQEEADLMFGKDYHKWIEVRDHYSSFYLVLKNAFRFIDNLNTDYLSQEGIDLYNKIIELKKEYENIVCDSDENEDRYYDLEDEIEEKSKELLSICEKQLLSYEKYDDHDIELFLADEFQCNGLFDDYYIKNDDETKIYEDISYTKTYN